MTFGLCNPEYYRGAFLKIRKSMEVREEGMGVHEEAAFHVYFTCLLINGKNYIFCLTWFCCVYC